MQFKRQFYFLGLIGLIFLFACGPKALKPQAQLDTPGHHVTNGDKFLERGRLDEALSEFVRARQLAPKYSPAYVGVGLVQGLQGNFKKAFEAMKRAKKYAADSKETTAVCVGYIRLYTLAGPAVYPNWLGEARAYFERARRLSPADPAAYFYMGQAAKQGHQFSEAADMFRKVLDIDKDFVAAADREYATVQRIERAMPGTTVGKKIALLNTITRADVAALFIEELKVDEIYKNRAPQAFDTAFQSPEKKFQTGEYVEAKPAADIADHVLRADIEAVLDIGIKGLQPGPDHRFRPDKTITRAEFAMMVEDILVKITDDDGLATKFIGMQSSPFPDLRSDLPFFNAVMVCVTRNIMETADPATGAFDPQGPVSGAEALLSIRQMKIQLKKL